MIAAILGAVSSALSVVNHLWDSYNRSDMVQANVAQMSQVDQDKHARLIAEAMTAGKQQQTALDELRKLTSES